MKKPVIVSSKDSMCNFFQDIIRYRELFLILAKRDISVRYKQTILGVLWVLIRPLLAVIIFVFVFLYIAKVPSDSSTPYVLIVSVAMLPWQFFSSSLQEASSSLIQNEKLITKIYFPRVIIPISAILASFVDFLLSFLILVFFFFYYSFPPSINLYFLPFVVVHLLLAIVGPSLFFSTLSLKYRDFRYIVPLVLQLGFYILPIGYSLNLVPVKYKDLYLLNPLVTIIEEFRWSILGESPINTMNVLYSSIFVLCVLILGLYYFRKNERHFSDLI